MTTPEEQELIVEQQLLRHGGDIPITVFNSTEEIVDALLKVRDLERKRARQMKPSVIYWLNK